MEKIDSKAKDSPSLIFGALGVGLIAAGGLLWYLSKNDGKKKKDENVESLNTLTITRRPVNKIKDSPLTTILSPEVLHEKIAKQLEEENLSGPTTYLTKDIILAIIDCSIALILPRFKEMNKKNRQDRRAVFEKNMDKYFEIVINGINEFEAEQNLILQNILKQHNIEDIKYTQSLQYHSENDKQFIMVTIMLYEKLKLANVVEVVDLSLEQGIKIFQKQIQIAKEDNDKLNELNPEDVASVKQTLVHDKIYQLYQIEDEDLIINQIEKNWENDSTFLGLMNQIQLIMN